MAGGREPDGEWIGGGGETARGGTAGLLGPGSWWDSWKSESADKVLLACGCLVSVAVVSLALLGLVVQRRRRRQGRATPQVSAPTLIVWRMVADLLLSLMWLGEALVMAEGTCAGARGQALAFLTQFLVVFSEALFGAHCIDLVLTLGDPFAGGGAFGRSRHSVVAAAAVAFGTGAVLLAHPDWVGEAFIPVCYTSDEGTPSLGPSATGASLPNLLLLYLPVLGCYCLSVATAVHASVVLGYPLAGFDRRARLRELRGLQEFVFAQGLAWGGILVLYLPVVLADTAAAHAPWEDAPVGLLFGTFIFCVGAKQAHYLLFCTRLWTGLWAVAAAERRDKDATAPASAAATAAAAAHARRTSRSSFSPVAAQRALSSIGAPSPGLATRTMQQEQEQGQERGQEQLVLPPPPPPPQQQQQQQRQQQEQQQQYQQDRQQQPRQSPLPSPRPNPRASLSADERSPSAAFKDVGADGRNPMLSRALQRDVLHYTLQGLVALLQGEGFDEPQDRRCVVINNPYTPLRLATPGLTSRSRADGSSAVVGSSSAASAALLDADDDEDLEAPPPGRSSGSEAPAVSATSAEPVPGALLPVVAPFGGSPSPHASSPGWVGGLLGAALSSVFASPPPPLPESELGTPLMGPRELERAQRSSLRREQRLATLSVSPLLFAGVSCVALSLAFSFQWWVVLTAVGTLLLLLLILTLVWNFSVRFVGERYRAVVTEHCAGVFSGVRGERGSALLLGSLRGSLNELPGQKQLAFKASGGRSGAFMVTTRDNRWIIKTIEPGEKGVLLRLLPELAQHWRDEPGSAIAHIVGLFELRCFGRRTFDLIVMENIVPRADATFDLKGSWVDRTARQPTVGAVYFCKHCSLAFEFGDAQRQGQCVLNRAHEPRRLLKDNDFQLGKVLMPLRLSRSYREQVARDANWLAAHGMMDYSLLVGVRHRLLRLADEHVAAQAGAPERALQRLRNGEGVPAVLLNAPALYHLGIIDFLTRYDLAKRLERFAKVWLLCKNDKDRDGFSGVSACDPWQYRDRFLRRVLDETVVDLGDLVQVVRQGDLAPIAVFDVSGAQTLADLVAMVVDAEPSARNLRFALEEDSQGNCEGQPLDERSWPRFRATCRERELSVILVDVAGHDLDGRL
jgi:hypothetical protein